jgi:hypothetical protein
MDISDLRQQCWSVEGDESKYHRVLNELTVRQQFTARKCANAFKRKLCGGIKLSQEHVLHRCINLFE